MDEGVVLGYSCSDDYNLIRETVGNKLSQYYEGHILKSGKLQSLIVEMTKFYWELRHLLREIREYTYFFARIRIVAKSTKKNRNIQQSLLLLK